MSNPNVEAARAIKHKDCPICGLPTAVCHSTPRNGRKSWRIFCVECKLTTTNNEDLRSAKIEWNGSIMRALKEDFE